jgi:hypothetical protein
MFFCFFLAKQMLGSAVLNSRVVKFKIVHFQDTNLSLHVKCNLYNITMPSSCLCHVCFQYNILVSIVKQCLFCLLINVIKLYKTRLVFSLQYTLTSYLNRRHLYVISTDSRWTSTSFIRDINVVSINMDVIYRSY